MKKIAYSVILLLCSYYGFSQVCIGTTVPDASPISHIKSSDKGFLPPIVSFIVNFGPKKRLNHLILS